MDTAISSNDLEDALYGEKNFMRVELDEDKKGLDFDAVDTRREENSEQSGNSSDTHSGWSEEERLAVDMRERNPDITLEESLAKAKQIVESRETGEHIEGVTTGGEEQKSVKEQLSEIESKLEELGKSEGLFTDEVRQLVIQHSKMAAIDAAQEKDRQADADRAKKVFDEKVDESSNRVACLCPEVSNPNSNIRAKMAEVYDQLAATNSSILYDASAPEKIFALANMELPENERYDVVKRRSETEQSQPAMKADNGTKASVAMFSPVSGSHRSQAVSSVPPAQVAKMIRETNSDTLEQALYGTSGPQEFYFRL